MVMMFLQASFAGSKKVPGSAGVCAEQVMNTYLKDTLKTYGCDQIGFQSVDICAKANVTGRKGGDGFLCGKHACDGFLHLSFFLREHPR